MHNAYLKLSPNPAEILRFLPQMATQEGLDPWEPSLCLISKVVFPRGLRAQKWAAHSAAVLQGQLPKGILATRSMGQNFFLWERYLGNRNLSPTLGDPCLALNLCDVHPAMFIQHRTEPGCWRCLQKKLGMCTNFWYAENYINTFPVSWVFLLPTTRKSLNTS